MHPPDPQIGSDSAWAASCQWWSSLYSVFLKLEWVSLISWSSSGLKLY